MKTEQKPENQAKAPITKSRRKRKSDEMTIHNQVFKPKMLTRSAAKKIAASSSIVSKEEAAIEITASCRMKIKIETQSNSRGNQEVNDQPEDMKNKDKKSSERSPTIQAQAIGNILTWVQKNDNSVNSEIGTAGSIGNTGTNNVVKDVSFNSSPKVDNNGITNKQFKGCCDEDSDEGLLESSEGTSSRDSLIPFGGPGNQIAATQIKPRSLSLKKNRHIPLKDSRCFAGACEQLSTMVKTQANQSDNITIIREIDLGSTDNAPFLKHLDGRGAITNHDVNGESSGDCISQYFSKMKTKGSSLSQNEEAAIKLVLELRCNYKTPFIDSHCHLDYIYNKLNISSDRQYLSDWKRESKDVFPNNFLGCIPNFIDPNLFHEFEGKHESYDMNWLKRQVADPLVLGATYGVHPNYAHLYNDVDETMQMFCTEKDFKIIAIGECGLDTHRSSLLDSLDDQKFAFEKQLELAHRYQLPVVIHCRGGNCEDNYRTERECLGIMKSVLSPFHTIHRHCFTMDVFVYDMWIRAFPNTFFGFTPGIDNFSQKQLDAVRKIPLTRILLETDAPYFRPQMYDNVKKHMLTGPAKVAFPGMAIFTAYCLARIKNYPMECVLDITTQNTRRCYRLW